MRLAELWKEPDWITLREELPASIFEGWKAHYKREPWGSEHLYKFLAHAFVLLVQAFHLREFALKLRSSDFLFWVTPDDEPEAVEEEDDGMSDQQQLHYARVLEARQQILAEQAAEAKAMQNPEPAAPPKRKPKATPKG